MELLSIAHKCGWSTPYVVRLESWRGNCECACEVRPTRCEVRPTRCLGWLDHPACAGFGRAAANLGSNLGLARHGRPHAQTTRLGRHWAGAANHRHKSNDPDKMHETRRENHRTKRPLRLELDLVQQVGLELERQPNGARALFPDDGLGRVEKADRDWRRPRN